MLPFRRIVAFFGRLVVIYTLLVLPWPGIEATYAAVFSAGGNLVFRSLIPGGSVRFKPVAAPSGKLDTHIRFVNKRSGATAGVLISSREPAYLQTAFLVSLVLATPLPWRRRLWALLWGLILAHMVTACQLLIIVLHMFSARVFLLKPTPASETILKVANPLAMNDVVMLLTIPVLIWILVSYRRTDWSKWVWNSSNASRG